jgi:hypothetical protein
MLDQSFFGRRIQGNPRQSKVNTPCAFYPNGGGLAGTPRRVIVHRTNGGKSTRAIDFQQALSQFPAFVGCWFVLVID